VWLNTGFTSSSVTWSGNSGPVNIGGYDGVAVGDVNEDGEPDIIAGNCEVGDIDVWFGNGDGTWWDAYLETPPVADNEVVLAKRMIGDGQLSAITLSSASTTTEEWSVVVIDDSVPGSEVWEVNNCIYNGFLCYNTHVNQAITNVPYTSDDGEVSFTITSGIIPFRIGDRFQFRTASGSRGVGPRPERLGQILGMTRIYDGVATGDFDRDGNLDIVAGNAGGWGVQVWFGNGKGEWRLAQATPPNPKCKNAGAGYITTENSFINAGADIMAACIARDPRSLYPLYCYPPNNVGVKTYGYLTSDFDWVITVKELAKVEDLERGENNRGNEEVVDILLNCYTVVNDEWTITIGTPTTTFTVEAASLGPQANTGTVGEVYTSDYNEVTFTVTSSTLAQPGDILKFRTVPCSFTDNQPERPSEHIGYFSVPYVAYWNDEVAFTMYGNAAVKPQADIYEFTTYYPGIVTNGTYYDVAVADLNRDGYDDIVAANKGDGGIQVWTNNGRGVWLKNPGDDTLDPWVAEECPINIGNYSGVTIVDFDQDGLLDIVGAHDITGGIGIEVWRQVIDWEPPYVTESSIADGASDVPVESEIVFTFNEEIDHTTLNPETVKVEGSESGPLQATLIYYTEESMLLISPERDFRVGERVTVTLRGVIKDLVGNSLDGDEDGVAEGSPIDDFILTFDTKDNIPQGLDAVANDNEQCIALSWYHNPEGNLGGYNIYRSTNATEFPYGQKPTNEPFLTFIEAGINQHCDYTATQEVAYYYAVTAVNDDILYPDESGFSETVSAVLLDKIPAAPGTPVAVVIERTNVTLSWDTVTTNEDGTPIIDLKGYNLYRSEVSGASYKFVAFIPEPTTTYNDSGLVEGETYYYKVTALDIFDNESNKSPELQVNLLYELAPAAPQNVRLTQRDPITVVVRWDPVTTNEDGSPIGDLSGYNVYRSDVTCTNFELANTGGPIAGLTEFVDEGLTTGNTYCYIVIAVDNVGKASEESDSQTIYLVDVVPVPENVIAFPVTEDSVKLIWEEPEYEISLAGYNIYYATTSGGPTTKVNVAPITGTTYLVTGLTECQNYYFKVTAVEEGGIRESDLDDCEEVWAWPHIPGDFNCDGDVTMDDYPTLEAAFGSTFGQLRYRAEVDLDQNLRVDGLDLADFARRL
ncbi:MAG: fibronectin type III domain-containing protein, partial [Deltaproteobacteria bacterium]